MQHESFADGVLLLYSVSRWYDRLGWWDPEQADVDSV